MKQEKNAQSFARKQIKEDDGKLQSRNNKTAVQNETEKK
jgi:hypothetical protein